MEPANPRILTINGGSSSIKFALFEAGDSLQRILEGGIERIGLPQATFQVKGLHQADNFSRPVTAPDHRVVLNVVDRLPGLGSKGAYLKQQMQDKLIEHEHFIDQHGEDMPEIRNWKWSKEGTQEGNR